MEGSQTTKAISMVCAGLVTCLLLAQPAQAKDGQVADPRDSVVPIVVMTDSPPEPDASGASAESRPGSNAAAPARDDSTRSSPLFADVPVPAWLLLVTCLLCAGFGPRAVRGFRDDAQ